MRKMFFLAAFLASLIALPAVAAQPGDLITLPDDGDPDTNFDTAVYYYGSDGNRYAFPNERVYFSWYQDFSSVKTVAAEEMSSLQLAGNVTYRPGIRMVKIQTDPKTYAVMPNGVLRWVTTEQVATELYGQAWNTMIDDVPDTFFTDYRIGEPIGGGDLYDPSSAAAFAPTIGVDKLLDQSAGNVVFVTDDGFFPATKTVAAGTTVTWVSVADDPVRVSSNNHPTHTLLPGFDSPTLELGQEYDFSFVTAGSHGYHDHWMPGRLGTMTVSSPSSPSSSGY